MLPNENISKFLESYCTSQVAPEYAVLLKGGWGVGKTHFVKNEIKRLETKRVQCLYLSLYGLTLTQQIDNALFKLLHPLLGSKGMALTSRVLKGLLHTTLKVDLDGEGEKEVEIGLRLPQLTGSDFTSGSNNYVLFIDDLERCQIPKNELLGYLNSFVEHQAGKMILIGDEEKIHYKDSINTNNNESEEAFRLIKEKLIGKTFEIKPNIENAIDSFVESVGSPKIKIFLFAKRETLKTVYEASGYKNLRHLRQSILDFERFCEYLPNNALDKAELMEKILGLYCSYSFEIYSGSLLSSDIVGLYNRSYASRISMKNDPPATPEAGIVDRYKFLVNYASTILPEECWGQWFQEGSVSSEEIKAALLNSDLYNPDRMPKWARLWRWAELRDSDFTILRGEVWQELISVGYETLGEVKHVAGIFLNLISIGLSPVSEAAVLKAAKRNLVRLEKEGKLTEEALERDPFDMSAWGGLGFQGLELVGFKKLNQIIQQIVDSINLKRLKSIDSELLPLLESDPILFIKRITFNNSSEQKYFDIPIFKYIKPKKFTDSLCLADPWARRRVIWALEERYKFQNINEKLIEEKEWLEKVSTEFKRYADKNKGKVSSHLFGVVAIKVLNKAIASLSATTSPSSD